MKIIVREAAEADLEQIFAWITKENPAAAVSVVRRIRDRINALELDSLAHMGRPGLDTSTRELIEYPYIIVYEVHDQRREVEVLAIFHGAQNRERER
jgi:toxin ParE1/3/4